MSVTRYRLSESEMEVDDDGCWVAYEDYDRLRRELANLERTAGIPAMYDDPVRVAARAALQEDRNE